MPGNMTGKMTKNLKAATVSTGLAATGALRVGTKTVQQGVEVAGKTADAAMTAAKSAANITKEAAKTTGIIGVSAMKATGTIGAKTLETTAKAAVNALDATAIIAKKGFEVTAESGSKLIGEAGKVADAATAISGDAVVAVIDTFGLGVGRAKLSLLESKLHQDAKTRVLTEDTIGQYIDQLGAHYNETISKLLTQLTLLIEGQGLAFETLIAMYKQLNCKKRWLWGYTCDETSDAKIKEFTSLFERCHSRYAILINKINYTKPEFSISIGQFKSQNSSIILTKGRDIESKNFTNFKELIKVMQSNFDALFDKMNSTIETVVDDVVEKTENQKNMTTTSNAIPTTSSNVMSNTTSNTIPNINVQSPLQPTGVGGRKRTRLRKNKRQQMKRTVKKYHKRYRN